MVRILSGDGVHVGGPPILDVLEFNGRKVVGWMPPNVRTSLQSLIDEFQVESVIEVGSFLGLSACWFAERVGSVVCVDHFAYKGTHWNTDINRAFGYEVTDDQYTLFLNATSGFDNISHYKMPSLKAAELDLEADLVYVDAGHEYADVQADVEAWTPHARKVICGDDNTTQWPSVGQYAEEIGANVEGRVWWKAL